MNPNYVMIPLMIVVFYFFMIRPQQKKQKELKNFRENIKAGDKVVTIGGVHGTILEVTSNTVLINSEGTKIRFEKSAISQNAENLLGSEKA